MNNEQEHNNNASCETPLAGLRCFNEYDAKQNVQMSKRGKTADIKFLSYGLLRFVYWIEFCILTCVAIYVIKTFDAVIPTVLIYILLLFLGHISHEQMIWKYEVIKHLRQIRDSLEDIEQRQNKPDGDVK